MSAQVCGDVAEEYEIHIDIKAVTYNEMFVRKENGKWVAQVVLDV
ncbi:archease [Nanoarchaeota archaeon]